MTLSLRFYPQSQTLDAAVKLVPCGIPPASADCMLALSLSRSAMRRFMAFARRLAARKSISKSLVSSNVMFLLPPNPLARTIAGLFRTCQTDVYRPVRPRPVAAAVDGHVLPRCPAVQYLNHFCSLSPSLLAGRPPSAPGRTAGTHVSLSLCTATA